MLICCPLTLLGGENRRVRDLGGDAPSQSKPFVTKPGQAQHAKALDVFPWHLLDGTSTMATTP